METVQQQKTRKEYAKFLRQYHWTFFCTFTTSYSMSVQSARRYMVLLNDFIKKHDPNSLLFWCAEFFECKDGCHVHALLKTSLNERFIASWWERRYGISDVRKYNSTLNGAEYVTKYLYFDICDFDMW